MAFARMLAAALMLAAGHAQAGVIVLAQPDKIADTTSAMPLPDGSMLRIERLKTACRHLPPDRSVTYRSDTGRCILADLEPRLPAATAQVAGAVNDLETQLANGSRVVFNPGLGQLCLPEACQVMGNLPANPPIALSAAASPPPAAEVSSFSASPLSVTAGAAVLLDWSALNVATCQLSASVGTLDDSVGAQGSLTVNPDQTTIYTLHCSAPGGFDAAQLVVDVTPPPASPRVLSFAASPASVYAGETLVLSWRSSDTSSCSIEGEAAGLRPSGQIKLYPAASRTYLLHCTGSGGAVTAKRSVTVSPMVANVEVEGLSAKPASIRQGAATTLSWNSEAADYCLISNDIDRASIRVAAAGSVRLTPGRSTQYLLNCYNARSRDSASAEVQVTTVAGKLRVSSFDGFPRRLIAGGQSQLIWTTANAAGCRVMDDRGSAPIFVPLNGDAWVQIDETTTFRAACAATQGQAEGYVTVEVVDETVLVGGFEG